MGVGVMENTSVLTGLLYGGFASCLADIITLPVDVTKTRLQLAGASGEAKYKGALDCVVRTVRSEGISALWKGLEPALWRQASYGSMRYGFYSPIKDAIAPGVAKKDLSLHHKIIAGGLSGAFSSAIANPCDLVKVRMQAGPSTTGHTYRWFWPAFADIVRKEGVLGLWKGVGPTCGRATVLAAAELASYDQIKGYFLKKELLKEGIGLHFAVATCAGFIGAFACNPFDVVKSRVMNQPADPKTGRGTLYSGMIDCFGQSVRNEGITSLWKGFIPAWARVGPRVIIIFIVMEQLKKTFEKEK